jgi:LysR family transcriptional regulator, cys regulon transcriptional activator
MTLQQLRYFCEIAASDWNISKASRTLNTSQPGISRQMQALEQDLGITLFVRRSNRIVGVTDLGNLALATAKRIVGEADGLKTLRSRFDEGVSAKITIAATHTQARHALPPIIKQYAKLNPGVEVFLQQGVPSKLARLVDSREADISISTMPPVLPDDVVLIPCSVSKRVAVMPSDHPLAKSANLSLAQIAQFPIITYDGAFIGRSVVLSIFEKAGLAPNVVISAVDTDIMKAYAAQGLGIAIMSDVAFDETIDRGLSAITVDKILGEDTIYIGLRRFTHLRRAVREFITLLVPEIDLASVAHAVNGTA